MIDPERKRKIIGNEFIKVFEAAARGLRKTSPGRYRFLAQGTLYPDVIESVSISGNPAALIKSHHNVGGLPERMKFKLVEPLRQLFKDEVREVGLELGLPKEIVHRQPFPGPGLAVRILGEITAEKLRVVREADSIVLEEMKASGWYYKVWQSFAVLLPVQSVGVMGDERTYENTIALRIVESRDGMTADWVRIPYDLLARISTRIINEVSGVNRVCYRRFQQATRDNRMGVTRAIYPGSFDPLTLGHIDIIHRACQLFDSLIVAVAQNEAKAPLFTADERISMIEEVP